MKNVEIYTDGGCRGNGQDRENIGGIGGVLIYGDYQKEFKKGYRNTTNNKMELLAVITALKMLKEPCRVTIHSDSAYVVNAFNQILKRSRIDLIKSVNVAPFFCHSNPLILIKNLFFISALSLISIEVTFA